jgi:hypothetical protein
MRILGLTVGRNEADRYLTSMLSWAAPLVDELFFFDDRSDDATPEIARAFDVTVAVRGDKVPGLLEHEGRFRQAAWDLMCEAFEPEPGDWVLSVDCDEFVVAGEQPEREALLELTALAETRERDALGVRIHEVFAFSSGWPMVRTDGYWGQIIDKRLIRWRPGGRFADAKLGCGSAPTYTVGRSSLQDQVSILHFGYAHPDDREAKYRRYRAHAGHSPSHIESILGHPVLHRYAEGVVPEVRRAS